jgi:hypothetical protein
MAGVRPYNRNVWAVELPSTSMPLSPTSNVRYSLSGTPVFTSATRWRSRRSTPVIRIRHAPIRCSAPMKNSAA